MNPFVKHHMKVHFPPSIEYIREINQIAALDKKDELRKDTLRQELGVAEEAAAVAKKKFLTDKSNSTLKQSMKKVYSKKNAVFKRVQNEMKLMDRAKEARYKSKPTPAWIKAAHSAFRSDSTMLKYITADSHFDMFTICLLYTSPSPRDYAASRMPSSA